MPPPQRGKTLVVHVLRAENLIVADITGTYHPKYYLHHHHLLIIIDCYSRRYQ
jgi:hypothetical protein